MDTKADGLGALGARDPLTATLLALREAVPPGFRFVFHVGTPKTGTTALQHVLYASTAELAEHGISYARSFAGTRIPRHRFLVKLLLDADRAGLARALEEIVRELPGGTRTVLLSAEGVYNHWWDFPPDSKAMIADVASVFELEFWACFREPEAFALAFYAQAIVNPPNRPPYGTDMGLDEMLESAWFARRLDYAGFIDDAERLIGAGKLRTFRYGADVVERILHALGVAIPADVPRANASLRAPGLDVVRVANRYDTSLAERAAIIDLARRLDAVLGERAAPLRPSDAARDRIRELSAAGWAAVADRIAADEQRFARPHA
jgi:hypothetical protein